MKFIPILLLILASNFAWSQDNRYGKVSKEELKKTESKIAPDSPAEILYEKTNIEIRIFESEGKVYLVQEVEARIKVYDKNNTHRDYLQLEIPMYAPTTTRDKIISFKAVTYNLEGDKIVETKVKNSDIFTEKINKYWEVQKTTFPNVKDGSVIEYKYTMQSPFYRNIPRWYFQGSIPVMHSELKFSHPSFFDYSIDNRGEEKGKISHKTLPNPNLNYDTKVVEMVYQNLKPLNREPFVFNSNNLKSSVRFELLRFSHPGYITENYSTTWDEIGKQLNRHDDIGLQLKGNNFLKEEVASIIGDSQDEAEKVVKIFNHVKSNYAWNRMNSISAENGIRQTFKTKSGNVADINLLLVAMLRQAGVNANPVVLSTVGNLMLNYSYPSISSLNYMVVAAEIKKGLYLMDATEKASKINMLPLRALNHRGFMLLSDDKMREIPLMNVSQSNVKTTINVNINDDGTITGNFNETKDEYFALNDNINRRDDPKEFEKEYLANYTFDVENFKIDENPTGDMIRYSFKFNQIPGVEKVSNKILFNPLFFTQTTKPSFHLETRNYPLEFGTSSNHIRTIRIKIPDGYKVESLPAEKQETIDGNKANYVYKIVENNGYLEMVTVYQITESILPPTYYKPMKTLESKIISAENQQVVLVKI